MGEKNVSIVCEIGMNHMGDKAYATQYVEALCAAKPDGVTFQIREKEYYERQTPEESVLLSDTYYQSVAQRLQAAGVRFGIGLCDSEKLAFFESIGTDFYKILSKDVTNIPLVAAVLQTGKPVYISTGMSDEADIETLLASIDVSQGNLSLIHTQLSYEDADTNLSAIARLKKLFGLPVAFGSHATSVAALYAAMGFGPSALFFYVKGDRPITHKDEKHAVTLHQVTEVIENVRRLSIMIGSGIKQKMDNRIADQKK